MCIRDRSISMLPLTSKPTAVTIPDKFAPAPVIPALCRNVPPTLYPVEWTNTPLPPIWNPVVRIVVPAPTFTLSSLSVTLPLPTVRTPTTLPLPLTKNWVCAAPTTTLSDPNVDIPDTFISPEYDNPTPTPVSNHGFTVVVVVAIPTENWSCTI